MSYRTQRPHVASYLIIRKSNKVAFLLRSNTQWMKGYYGLPSGKVEEGETFTEGLIREAKEEIGIDLEEKHLNVVLVVHRHEEHDSAPDWVDVYFEATGWSGEPKNKEPHLHSELLWLDLNDLPGNVIPALKDAFANIESGIAYAEYGWA